MRDPYKAKIIRTELQKMFDDPYYMVQLKGTDCYAINLDQNALRLLEAYYDGVITEEQIRDLTGGLY